MITTKLHIPSPSKNTVSRSDIYEKLNDGLDKKLVLISAPAGFGKTTIVSHWINRNEIPTAWYSIDKRDNDPVEFLTYIIAGIQNLIRTVGRSSQTLLNAPQRPNIESIIGLLINDILKAERDFILVLDDFHLISSNEVIQGLNFLLEHLPEKLHIVILTRSDPSISLARLRSQNQLVEIRSSELSFSVNDISTFFNKKLKLGLSAEDIHSLHLKTEGWIAGLQLTGISLQNSNDISGFIRDFTGDHRYIMDYLMEEVLGRQSDEVKKFLLHTSILEQFSGSLCNFLLNREDSQQILESLERDNMFIIPLDTERHWYRYHHLFGDLLQQQLRILYKGEITKLHYKACLWYEQNKLFDLAIDQVLEAGDFERSIELLDQTVEKYWEDGHHGAILKYGEILPDEFIEKTPNFSLYYSWILISIGKFREANRFLNAAERTLAESADIIKDNTAYSKLLGRISVAFAYLTSSSGDVENILNHCQKAYKNVSKEDSLWYSWTCFSFGVAYLQLGNYPESNRAFSEALEAGKKTGNLYLISATVIRFAFSEMRRGNYRFAYAKCNELLELINEGGYSQIAKNEWSFAGLYTTLGYIQNEWGELDEAIQNIKIGYELSKNGNDVTLQAFNIIVYARALRTIGDRENVEMLIKELDIINQKKELFPFLMNTYLALKLGVYVRFNQLENAHQFIRSHQLSVEDEVTGVNELLYTSFAWLLLAEAETDMAKILLLKLHALAESENSQERLIEIKILCAVLGIINDQREEAITYLIDAIALAEEENILMFFVHEGEYITELLEEVSRRAHQTEYGFSKKFLNKIILYIEKEKKRKENRSIGILSKREIDVLALMAAEYSNQEIADKLFISLNTVKTHAKNIHLKLDVVTRTKAVTRAKELGLI